MNVNGVKISGISILCISLFVHIFLLTIGFPANVEIVIQFLLVLMSIIFEKKIVFTKEVILWLFPVFILLLYTRQWTFDSAMKYIIWYFVGWLTLLIPRDKRESYLTLKSINWMSFGVYLTLLIQQLVPDFWKRIEVRLSNRDAFVVAAEKRSGILYGIAIDKSSSLLLAMVGIGVFWYLSELNNDSGMKRVLGLIVNIYVIFYSGSRTLLIVIPFTIALVEIISSDDKHKVAVMLKAFTVIVLLVGVGIFIYFFVPDITAIRRIANSLAAYQNGRDISSGRTELYLAAIEGIKKNGLFSGSGWYSFNIRNTGIIDAGAASYVHNIVLQLLHDIGLIGTILFFVPFVYTLFETIKFIKTNKNEKSPEILLSLYLQLILLIESILHVGVLSPLLMQVYFIAIILSAECRRNNLLYEESGV